MLEFFLKYHFLYSNDYEHKTVINNLGLRKKLGKNVCVEEKFYDCLKFAQTFSFVRELFADFI